MNMAIVHDIVLLLQAIGYWLADRDFERRHNHGTQH